jgi:hypothetical protein
VICREESASPPLIRLAGTLLALLVHAQHPNGSFHNRLSFDRRWTDTPETGDCWGRARRQRSASPRAMAFAAIGAAELLSAIPDHVGARQLLIDATTTVGRGNASSDWPWPEPRLAYANAVLAEVHLAAGQALGDSQATAVGQRLLTWLIDQESPEGGSRWHR